MGPYLLPSFSLKPGGFVVYSKANAQSTYGSINGHVPAVSTDQAATGPID